MSADFAALETLVRARFGAAVLGWTAFRGGHALRVRREQVLEVLGFLRDEPAAGFKLFTDLTCLDRLKLPADMSPEGAERFEVVYHLTRPTPYAVLRIKVSVPEDPCEIDSASGLFAGAEWAEREAYDMFGVWFKGNPDLRRILMPEEYEGHPLRKDYPLKGRGERDNFPRYSEMQQAQS